MRGCPALGTASTVPPAVPACQLPPAAHTLWERLRGSKCGEQMRRPVSPCAGHPPAVARPLTGGRVQTHLLRVLCQSILSSSPVTPVTPVPTASLEHCLGPRKRHYRGADTQVLPGTLPWRRPQGHPAVGDTPLPSSCGGLDPAPTLTAVPQRASGHPPPQALGALSGAQLPSTHLGAGTEENTSSLEHSAPGGLCLAEGGPGEAALDTGAHSRDAFLPGDPRTQPRGAGTAGGEFAGVTHSHSPGLAGSSRQGCAFFPTSFFPPRAPRSERCRVGDVGC